MTDTRTSISRPCDLELDAAVLRQALLGDVQPGHDLQAADDRRLKAVDLRRHRLRAAARRRCGSGPSRPSGCDSMCTSLARELDRFEQNLVHQPNDRGLLGHLATASEPSASSSSSSSTLVVLALGEQAVDRLAADAQVRLDQLGDLVAAWPAPARSAGRWRAPASSSG